MAMTIEDFVKRTKAEVVCGNLVVGLGPERRIVGVTAENGSKNLNDNGLDIMKHLEAGLVRADALAANMAVIRSKKSVDHAKPDA